MGNPILVLLAFLHYPQYADGPNIRGAGMLWSRLKVSG